MIKQTKLKQRIIGENIIVNNGRVSFLYSVPSFDYGNKKLKDIENHIERLYSLISILNSKTPGLEFCLSNLQIPLTQMELRRDLIKNVQKWMSPYSEREIKFIDRIQTGCYTLFILEIFVDLDKNTDQTITEIAKGLVNSIENSINNSLDLDRIFKKETEYSNILRNFSCGRTTQYITFRYLLQNYFPGIYFTTTSFDNIKYNTILNSIYQEYEFKMEEFYTDNNFSLIFGIKPKKKYCSILQYTDLPIVKENTILNFIPDGLRVFVRIPDQKEILLSMKRQRADLQYSVENADTDISNEIETNKLYNTVINRLKDGILGCEVSIVQLVVANTREELIKERTDIIVNMLDNDITCRPVLDQFKAVKTYFINRKIESYDMMSDLRYALSLKLDNFTSIGDFDSKDEIGLLKIGTEI